MSLGGCNLIPRVSSVKEGKRRDPGNEVGVAESCSHDLEFPRNFFSCEYLRN